MISVRLLVDEVPRVPASVVHALGVVVGTGAVDLVVTVAGEQQLARIALSWTRLPTGGARPWWRCPGPGCAARRRWLYFVPQGIRCRGCPELRSIMTYRGRRDRKTSFHERVVRPMLSARRRRTNQLPGVEG